MTFLLPQPQAWQFRKRKSRSIRWLVCHISQTKSTQTLLQICLKSKLELLITNTSILTPSRPQKYLRRRHPRLPQLPLLQTIPHPYRHTPSSRLLCLRNLRRNFLLGLQAWVRIHKAVHRNRSCHLHTPKRFPDLLDLGRRERNRLHRHQCHRRQNPDLE